MAALSRDLLASSRECLLSASARAPLVQCLLLAWLWGEKRHFATLRKCLFYGGDKYKKTFARAHPPACRLSRCNMAMFSQPTSQPVRERSALQFHYRQHLKRETHSQYIYIYTSVRPNSNTRTTNRCCGINRCFCLFSADRCAAIYSLFQTRLFKSLQAKYCFFVFVFCFDVVRMYFISVLFVTPTVLVLSLTFTKMIIFGSSQLIAKKSFFYIS